MSGLTRIGLVNAAYLRSLTCVLLCVLPACATGARQSLEQCRVGQAAVKADVVRSERSITELQGERETLRQDLATARKAKSRLEGDLIDAERRLIEARHIVDLQREELARGVQDRERLTQTNHDLEAKVADVAQLRQHMAEKEFEHGRLQVFEEALNRQSKELEEVKTALQSLRLPAPKSTSTTSRTVAPLAKGEPVLYRDSAGDKKSVRVARGDTLLKLARQFRVDVMDLMKLNHLTGDRILIGQELLLPDPSEP